MYVGDVLMKPPLPVTPVIPDTVNSDGIMMRKLLLEAKGIVLVIAKVNVVVAKIVLSVAVTSTLLDGRDADDVDSYETDDT